VPFTYAYPRPAVTCDSVVFTMRKDDLAVLLVQRKDEPFRGRWALPGGFVDRNESLDRAAARELHEETGLSGLRLEQLAAFGDAGRDPRGHTVTIAYVTFLVAEANVSPGDDAGAVEWTPLRKLALDESSDPPPRRRRAVEPERPRKKTGGRTQLAFDHAKIIMRAYRRLCRHLDDPVHDRAFDLVPSRFTLAELRHLYEVVLGRPLPPRWFADYLLRRELVVPVSRSPRATRAAGQLYRWNRP
jgi:8-oxo-dGTP diphosphatase